MAQTLATYNFDDGGLSRQVTTSDPEYAEITAGKNIAFFKVRITERISMNKNYFSATVWQKGNKLGTYRNISPE
jgi:hypothetical protein